MGMSDEKELLYIKAKAYCDQKLEVHLTFKDGHWHNGRIISVSSDFFMLDEFKDGKMPVFFLELKPDGIRKYETPIKTADEVNDD